MANIAIALFESLSRRRQRSLLLELDDHLLADIGLNRADLRQPARRNVKTIFASHLRRAEG